MGRHSYAYDDDGRRIEQTVSGFVTEHLLDVQAGSAQVIAATTSGSTERYIKDRVASRHWKTAVVWTHPL